MIVRDQTVLEKAQSRVRNAAFRSTRWPFILHSTFAEVDELSQSFIISKTWVYCYEIKYFGMTLLY